MTDSAAEWEEDKFATLFSPATPRASPTLEQQQAALVPRYNHQPSRSVDSDFGAFISVPAVDDPLAGGSGGPGGGGKSSGDALIDFDSPAQGPQTQQQQQQHNGEENNSSLKFFDRFGREAKQSSEKNRHSFLDELLMHEDDPLYFLSDRQNARDEGDPSNSRGSNSDRVNDIASRNDDAPQENIIVSPAPPARQSPDIVPQRPSISPTRSSTLALHVTPAPPLADKLNAAANASTTSLDTSDAPRLAATSSSPPQLSSYSSLTSLSSRLMTSLLSSSTGSNDNTNYGRPAAVKKGVTSSTLEGLFTSDPSGDIRSKTPPSTNRRGQKQKEEKTSSKDRTIDKQPQLYRTSSSSSTSSTLAPTTAATTHPLFHIPFSQQINQDVQITHGTPFGRSSTITKGFSSGMGTFVGTLGSNTPFGPHVYIPPTGAPGYKGESYDWDRGYSEELIRELGDIGQDGEVATVERNVKVRESGSVLAGRGRNLEGQSGVGGDDSRASSVGGGSTSHKTTRSEHEDKTADGNGGVLDVAHLIEKKGGLVQLAGRKASTTPVLEVGLADMIRAYFPALARLPKSWTLVYSLDQHGISLNTLYDRCEEVFIRSLTSPATVAVPVAALLVIKDESGIVFGASLGREGIRRSRGRGYFGSGESFLWKFVDNQHLKVFKWTGKNDYVALCEPEFISFGGGDGNYGLYLDDTLYDGSSASCPTFDNEPLCVGDSPNKEEKTRSTRSTAATQVAKFECVGLEVWRIGP